jgi:type I restriction enzyme M protein
MNMLLHGIETPESDSPIHLDDALRDDPGERFDLVLANPPFGKKSSVTIVNAEGKIDRQDMTVVREDFWASTSNKQLQLRAAHEDAAEDWRALCGGGSRQRAVRGRRR